MPFQWSKCIITLYTKVQMDIALTVYTVNRFIFAVLKFCVFGTLGLLRASYFCDHVIAKGLSFLPEVEF